MGNFHLAVDGAHLVDGLYLWRESSVDAEYLLIDECSEGEVVKCLIEVLPGCGAAILLDDFVVEAVDSGDLP
jgi:hypothetical protein